MKITTFLSVILISVLLTGCTTFSNSQHQLPKEGSVLDATTTFIALEQGATELNPLLSWGNPVQTALASIGLKYGIKHILINNPPEGATEDCAMFVDTSVETLGVSAAAWNATAVIGGASTAVGIPVAILAGIVYWNWKDQQYQEMILGEEIDAIEKQ